MDIMELGAIGELVGAVAVIGSLLYLGLQVRQSTAASKASTEFAVTSEFNGLHRTVLSNPDLAQLLIEVEAEEALDPVEQRLFRAYATHLHATWLGIQQAYSHGSISTPYFEVFKSDVAATCAQYPALAEMMNAGFMRYPAFQEMEIFESVHAGRPD